MTEEELLDYIKNKRYFCGYCSDLQKAVIEKGLIAIKEYDGMQCSGVQDMINKYFDVIKEKKNIRKWEY
ncbi:MAG: hypothetical protein PHF86_10215 [Candidatus Nanoarchaeia archaeon]|nr:hypothetical protein [Candidatus Nanoarchaeia archaeon]